MADSALMTRVPQNHGITQNCAVRTTGVTGKSGLQYTLENFIMTHWGERYSPIRKESTVLHMRDG